MRTKNTFMKRAKKTLASSLSFFLLFSIVSPALHIGLVTNTYAGGTVYGSSIPTNGLVLQYSLNNSLDNSVTPANSLQNNGGIFSTDISYTINANSHSIDFGTTNTTNKLLSTNNVWITGAASRTLCAWVKFDTLGWVQVPLYWWGDNPGKNFGLFKDGADEIRFWGDSTGYDAWTSITANTKWNQYCFSYDGTNLKGYYNGNLITTGDFTGGSVARTLDTIDSSLSLGMGGAANGSNAFPFKWKIDDVLVYNRQLSDAEISGLYNYIAPGWVDTNLALWLKADDAGTPATAWDDKSPNANPVETQGAMTLSAANSAHNFHPYFANFSSTNHFKDLDSSIAPDWNTNSFTINEVSIFWVGRIDSTTDVGVIVGIDDETAGNAAEPVLKINNASPRFYRYSGWPNNTHTANANVWESAIFSARTYGTNRDIGLNGLVETNTYDWSAKLVWDVLNVGYWKTPIFADQQGPFPGEMQEVIWYNTNVSDTERQKIQSYLAIKYGITLDQTTSTDYLASDWTKIWDSTTSGNYKYDIAGVGRDDIQELDQRISNSINSDSLVTFSLDNNFTAANNDAVRTTIHTNDLSFMTWANNDGINSWIQTDAPSNRQILGRTWKINETATVGSVYISVPDNSSTKTTKLPTEQTTVYLLTKTTDSDFSVGATETALTLNGTQWELPAGVNFTDAEYFTFATEIPPAPGWVFNSSSAQVNGVEYIFYEGYDSTPENGITGTIKNYGYLDDLEHPDDLLLNEDSDTFSLVLKTKLQIDIAGDYNFRALSTDDDVAIFINGTLQVFWDNATIQTGDVTLTAGQHDLEVRFSENGGGQTINIQYDGPDSGNTFTKISANKLFITSPQITAWYKADSGVTATEGANITAWSDASGRGNDLTLSVWNPTFYWTTTSELYNFNPSIVFSDDQLQSADQVNGIAYGEKGKTVFSVITKSNLTWSGWITALGRDSFNSASFGLYTYGNDVRLASWSNDTAKNNYFTQIDFPYILAGSYQNNEIVTSDNALLYGDGVELVSNTKNWTTLMNNNEDISIGNSNDNSSDGHDGHIMEVIQYPWVLSTIERQQVESYLAIKYGMTLDQTTWINYLSSNWTTIWDSTVAWNYNNNIFGIAKDTNSSLDQQISKSVNSWAIVTISTDTDFTWANGTHSSFAEWEYFIVSSNSWAITTQTTEISSLYSDRITREWKIQSTSIASSVNLKFDSFDDNYVLLADADGDFSSWAVNVWTLSASWEITGITLYNDQYFTLAIKLNSPTDFSNNVLWLDWNDSSTLYSDSTCATWINNWNQVGCWVDKSGQWNNVLQSIQNDKPVYNTNQQNWKPSLDFINSALWNDDRLFTSTSGQITANGPYTKFVVFKYDIINTSNNLISSDDTGSAFWWASINSVNVWHLNSGTANPWHLTSGAIWTTTYHIAATRYDNIANDWNLSVLNINGLEVDTDDSIQNNSSQPISIWGHWLTNGLDGKIAEAIVYNSALTDEEIDCVESYLSNKWNIAISHAFTYCSAPVSISLNKTNYPEQKVFQRNWSDQYNFQLNWTYNWVCTSVEASFWSWAYSVIDSSPSGNAFSGSLTAWIGQWNLSVRCTNDNSAIDTVANIWVWDIYVVAGQSNAEWHAQNAQLYTTVAPTATVHPTVYTDWDVWKIWNDDTDPGWWAGSVWPILGWYIAENTWIPVMFITTADGWKWLVNPAQWTKWWWINCSKGVPCFDNMINQVQEANPNDIKAILWFQWETDASNWVSRSAYNTGLDQFITDAQNDLPGTPDLISWVIWPWIPSAVNSTQIRLATMDAWDDNSSIKYWPQAYDIKISNDWIGDDVHYVANDEIQTLAFRWWKSLENHYYWWNEWRWPVINSATLLSWNNQIDVNFTVNSSLSSNWTLASDIWFVNDNWTNITVNTASIIDNNTVRLTLASAVSSSNITLTYAKDNTAEWKNILTDSVTWNTATWTSPLPADPFSDFTVTINNSAPSDITLSGSTINENNSIWDLIWNLSTTDSDIWDTFTYTFTTWTWDTNNSLFTISGSTLLANTSFDYETMTWATVRIKTTDLAWATFEKVFNITINDVDDTNPIFDKVDFVSNNTNTSYAKFWDNIIISMFINPADTWQSWNDLDFKIWTWTIINSWNFTTSGSPILSRNKTYTVQVWDNWAITVSWINFFDIIWNTLTWATLPYIPTTNVIVDTIDPIITFSDDILVWPTQSDDINIIVTELNIWSLEYWLSTDNICDVSDTYWNIFTSWTAFTINTETNNWQYICVKATDLAWNISYKSSTNPLNIDTTNPINPIITSPTAWANVWTLTPTLTWSWEVWSIIEIKNGSWAIVWTWVVDGSWNYNITISPALAEWSNTLDVTSTDSSWNTSWTTSLSVTIDVTPPVNPTIWTSPNPANNGTLVTTTVSWLETWVVVTIPWMTCWTESGWTVTCTETVSGSTSANATITVTDLAWNTNTGTTTGLTVDNTTPTDPIITSPTAWANVWTLTPTLTWSWEVWSVIEIKNGSWAIVWTWVVDWSWNYNITISPALAEWSNTLDVTSTDSSWNTSWTTSLSVTIDVTPPVNPTIWTSPNPANNGTLVTTTVSWLETWVVVTIPWMTCWTESGWTVTCTETVSGSTSANATITVTDLAWNTNTGTTTGLTVDNTTPTDPIITSPTAWANVWTLTPTLTWSWEVWSVIEIKNGSWAVVWTWVVDWSWNYNITISPALAEWSNTLDVTSTDSSWNTSWIASVSVIIDVTSPANPSITTPTNWNPVWWTSEPWTSVTITTPSGSTCTTTVTSTWSYSCALFPTPTNLENITAVSTDLAWNTGSTTETWWIDTSIPTTPTVVSPSNGNPVTWIAEVWSKVEVKDKDWNVLCTVDPVPASWTYSCSVPQPTDVSTLPWSVEVTDPAWNIATLSGALTTSNVDVTSPIAPTILSPTNGNPVTWSWEVWATVTITTPSGSNCTALVNASWSYSCTLSPTPVDWENITAIQKDPAWNTSPAITSTWWIDTSIPTTPTVVSPSNGNPVTWTAEVWSKVEVKDKDWNVLCTVDPVPASWTYSCSVPQPTDVSTLPWSVEITDPAWNIATLSGALTTSNVDVASPTIIPNTLTWSTTDTTATITWETSEPTSSEIVYGLTTTTNQTTWEQDITPRVTSHSLTLTWLQACTKYYYKTISRDVALNETINWIYGITTTGCIWWAEVLETKDFDVVLTASWAIWSNKLIVWTSSSSLEIEIPVWYLNSWTWTCAWTWAYFQLKQIEKNSVILNLWTPIFQKNVLKTYDLSAYCSATERVTSFNENLTVSMKYSNGDINGIKESSLLIYRYNINNSKWEILENCSVDTINNIVTCETSKFSTFWIFWESENIWLTWFWDSRWIDICPNNIDNSWSRYDLKCEKTPEEQVIFKNEEEKIDETTKEEIVEEIEENIISEEKDEENIKTKTEENKIYMKKIINGEEKEYSIENNYSFCKTIPKIVDLNNLLNKSNLEKLPTKFLDISNSKYKNEIIALEKTWIVNWTSETTFEPNRGITRAEYLAIVMKSHCYQYDLWNEWLPFYDVDKNSWQAKVIKKALALKIISWDVDKNWKRVFRPNDTISKAEALWILLNMWNFNIEWEVPNLKYTDIKAPWQVILAKRLEYLWLETPGLQDTTFNPNAKLNRDVLVNFLLKTLELYK